VASLTEAHNDRAILHPYQHLLIAMADDTRKTLQTQLWNIANTLRGKMGADEFRDYILGFIFYKYLSERMHLFADEILKHDGVRFDQIDETTTDGQEMLAAIKEESVGRLGYFLKPSELFHCLAEKGSQKTDNFILEDLTAVLKHIEASTMGHDSEDDFEGLFEDLDLGSSKLGKTENQKNELIAKVLVHLDQIDFRLADTQADVLGDAYEYLIGQFASGAGKKAGEFYTPQEVSTILAKIVTTGKTSLKNVYDPTCGSGSLLLRVAKEVEDVGSFYGQEMNPTTYNLARMNMILHGVHYQRFDLKNEDTLENPAPEHADLRFEAVVANPPFSAKWSASAIHENDDRFSAYGKLAPKTKADFAFVQHMVHHLDSGATMACVLPHGVLFRGAAEGHIRRYLIEDCNYLDAVIGLPANIFFGTGIPTCILVLKKQRENPDDILFIDASQHFEKVGNQNQLRPEDIERIVSTFRNRENLEKFSHVADRSEVEENDYNLNIPRYVDTFEEEEPVDLAEVSEKLVDLEKDMTATNQQLAAFCQELGISPPFSTRR
jgi:type I restriction enzyme M protein